MAPSQCGQCHQVEYQAWTLSKHQLIHTQCGACHGQLHSGHLQGCRQCHGDKHGAMFRQWPAVQKFDLPNSSDYVCIVCHDPHRGGLVEHRQACVVCHNDTLNRDVAAFHANVSEFFVPTENDGFVLRESTGAKLAHANPMGKALIAMPLSMLVFVLGTVVLFPVGVGVALLFQEPRTRSGP